MQCEVHWRQISLISFPLPLFFSFILYWLRTPNSSAVLKPEFTSHSTERLQLQPGRTGHQAACPVGLFLMLEPSHWRLWGQLFSPTLLPLGVCGKPIGARLTGSGAGSAALHSPAHRARLGLQLLHTAVKSSVDLRKRSTGGKLLEWLCPKGTFFSFKNASDKRIN